LDNPLVLWKGLQSRVAAWWLRQRWLPASWRRAPQRAGPWPALPAPLDRCASVVIPALDEAARIACVVRHALADSATAEVIVIDDSSTDDTAARAREAGAEVVTSTMLGKGASMRDGCEFARHDIVVYLDGDLAGLREGLVTELARPIARGEADFVKARFGRSGGRVTELTAKPMLKVFFPELARFAQPLGGLVAARRALLRALPFENGYGADIGLLIDAERAGARLAEVDIGTLDNDSQPLADLSAMANEVSRVIFTRARAAGRLHVEQISAMYETQRLATSTLDYALTRRRGRRRVLLLDLDGTVIAGDFALAMARATGQQAQLEALRAEVRRGGPPGAAAAEGTTAQRTAALFRFTHRQQFESVAASVPLAPHVVEWVNAMRRAGFWVGLITESWFVAAEILRRRVFADFVLAHTLGFDGDVCNGELHANAAFVRPEGGQGPALCRSHALRRLREDAGEPRIETLWAVADGLEDIGLLRAADRAFSIGALARRLEVDAGAEAVASFAELMAVVPAATAASEDPARDRAVENIQGHSRSRAPRRPGPATTQAGRADQSEPN
jgi:phosphoserine phosphatase